jgi:hypothetical protein
VQNAENRICIVYRLEQSKLEKNPQRLNDKTWEDEHLKTRDMATFIASMNSRQVHKDTGSNTSITGASFILEAIKMI